VSPIILTTLLALGHTDTSSASFVPPRLLVESPLATVTSTATGVVTLGLSLDAAGVVVAVELLEGLDAANDRRALDAARGLVFRPALAAGVAVPARVRYRYRFVGAHHHAPLAATSTTHAHDDDAGAHATSSSSVAHDAVHVHVHAHPHDHDDGDHAHGAPEAAEPAPTPALSVDVSGRRAARAASDHRFAIDAVRVAPKPGTGAADLLRRAPGVYLSQHSGEGKAHQLYVRGFDAAHGQDLEIHAGGVPVNEVSHVHAQGYADLHFLIPEVVRELRVVEGAFDPRQGDFAVVGSVDFNLGLREPGLLARVSGGQYGTTRGVLAYRPEGLGEDSFVAAELARSDGFGPARGSDRAAAIAQHVVTLGDHERLRVHAASYAARFASAGVVRADDVDAGRLERLGSYDPTQGGSSSRHQALVELVHAHDDVRAELSSWAFVKDLALRSNFTGFSGDPRGDAILQRNESVAVGLDARYGRRFTLLGETHRLELGVSARHDRVAFTQDRLAARDGAPYARELDADLGLTHVGGYADLELRVAPRVSLRGGLRLDAFFADVLDHLGFDGAGAQRSAGGMRPSPKLTVEVRVAPRAKLYAAYGAGFRSPQALSLANGERAPFTGVHTAELGARWAPIEGLELDAATFVAFVGDDLVFDPASGRNLAAGPTRRLGASLLARYTLDERVRATASLAWTNARLTETEEALPYLPPLVARLEADVRQPLGTLFGEPLAVFADVGVTVLGPRPLPFGERADVVALAEAGVGVELGRVALGVDVFNLFDSAWRDGEFVYASRFDAGAPPSLLPARHFTAGRPFTAVATLTLRW
jgi:hypothetical protein